MEALKRLWEALPQLLPVLAVFAVVAGGLWFLNWLLIRRREALDAEKRVPRRLLIILLGLLGIVIVILAVPMAPDKRTEVLRLFGLVLTAVIAFSSTTFVANGMAGLMLRAVGSFRPGDFIRVEGLFGRVTARGLLHTEIQTEDHDLATVPNLFLVSHPVKVMHVSGTVVSATVSLGYDNPHGTIEKLLLEAAEAAKLEDPFVQITELGDFSVKYRIAGFLKDVKQVLTARSNLRAMMLDRLHGGGIEIVSPTFMNQRRPDGAGPIIPPSAGPGDKITIEGGIPEELIFDKAEQAGRIETFRQMRDEFAAEKKKLEDSLKGASDSERDELTAGIEGLEKRIEAAARVLEMLEARKDGTEKKDVKDRGKLPS